MAGTDGSTSGTVNLDPDPCNTLRTTPSGLLAPRPEVAGASAGTAVGEGRSVDVDITPPADAGECPETWTVGARLTPQFGQAPSSGNLDLADTADGAWLPVPGAQVQLPEPGTYEVAYAAAGELNLWSQAQVGVGVLARLFNVTDGVPVPRAEGFIAFGARQTTGATYGSATKAAFITVTSPTTIRLEGTRTAGRAAAGSFTGIFANWTDVWWKKVAD
ncbi:hypothetical protein AB0N20_22620 [Streptomyces griseoincarnatus]